MSPGNEAESAFLQEAEDGGYTVDMTAVPEAKNELMPKAIYNCVVDEAEYKLSASAGLPMWALTLKVEDGEYAGRKLFVNMSFSEKALPYTKRTLAKIRPDLLTSDFSPNKIDDYGIQGMNVRAKTKVGKDQNNDPRTEVADLMAAADNSAFMGTEHA